MNSEFNSLKKQVQWMRWYIMISSSMILLLIISGFSGPEQKFGIIRAKGIVIEDSAGRDRILIGSPIPFSKYRVRTDTSLVRKYWAKNFGDGNQYMQWYKDYYNGAEGMVVMNEQGFDRGVAWR